MNTLAGMISGIVRSRKSQLSAMAKKAPDPSKVESRIKQFSRYLQNENVNAETYFMPFIEVLLNGLANCGPLVLAIDGSEIGRNCLVLMISVIYKKRALPLVWVVVQSKKGHFPEEMHCQLIQTVKPLLSEGCDVIFVGDGEFDGNQLQAEIDDNGWKYVCRTAKNRLIEDDGDQFALDEIHLQPGDCLSLPDVKVTQDEYDRHPAAGPLCPLRHRGSVANHPGPYRLCSPPGMVGIQRRLGRRRSNHHRRPGQRQAARPHYRSSWPG